LRKTAIAREVTLDSQDAVKFLSIWLKEIKNVNHYRHKEIKNKNTVLSWLYSKQQFFTENTDVSTGYSAMLQSYKLQIFVRFEVFTAVFMNSMIFCVVMPCSSTESKLHSVTAQKIILFNTFILSCNYLFFST
jgi:hypothetical protein